MHLLLKYGGPKVNFAVGMAATFAAIEGLVDIFQHFTWRGLGGLFIAVLLAVSCLVASRRGMKRD